MPISRDQRALYPPDWDEISRWVRFVRANGRCECHGECGTPHKGVGGRCAAANGQVNELTGSPVVLAAAHLDQDPSSDDVSRIVAFCQFCHLGYDRPENLRRRIRRRHGELVAGMTPML